MSEEQQDLLSATTFTDDLASHLGEIPEEVRKKWPKDLAALIDIFSDELERQGYAKEESQRITHRLLAAQSMYCGGRYFYLPKPDALEKAVRDLNLYNDWAGNNMEPSELTKKYKVSVQHVYRIIKEQRAYYRKRIQPELF
ncbi:MAG: Mor transcription activator family protein [Neptuniibacter sp.]